MNARLAVTLVAWAAFFLLWAAVVPQLWGWYRGRREPWQRWQVWCALAGVVLQFLFWVTHGWPMYGPTVQWLDALR